MAVVRHFSREGLVFDVIDQGPRDGDVVVLLHGFPQGAETWQRVVDRLAQAGYRTLAPNQRGYSPGARPRGARHYSLRAVKEDVLAMLAQAGVARAHVVGHDWGGAVAWALAAADPGASAPYPVTAADPVTPANPITSVTVVSTPHPGALTAALLQGQALRSWYMLLFQVRGLAERAMHPDGRGWRLAMRGVPENLQAAYAARMREEGALSAALSWYRAIPRELVSPTAPRGPSVVPSWFVWGARDPALGRTAAEATSRFVSAPYRFVVLPDAGHWIPERNADTLSDLIIRQLNGPQVSQRPQRGPGAARRPGSEAVG